VNLTDFTLHAAAEQLGISAHAVRMRWKRGQVAGYKKDGVVYVQLESATSQGSPRSQPVNPNVKDSVKSAREGWDIELQAHELRRLKAELREAKEQIEAERTRYDDLLKETRRDRDREQVLRQDLQRIMGRLEERLALPAPDDERLDRLERENGQLKSGVIALVGHMQGRKVR